MTGVRALAMLQIPMVWQAFPGVILRTDVFFLVRTIRTRAFARVMNPSDEIVVVRLLADSGQVRGKHSALHLIAFPDRVAGEAAAGLEQFLAVLGVAGLV